MEAILEQHTENIVLFIKKEYNICKDKQDKQDDQLAMKLPWVGRIIEKQCKGLRFNGGLYTQCTQICEEYCLTCQKNKYGTVYDRLKYSLGEYRDLKGRKEMNFMNYIKKNNICLKDIERECERVWGQKLPEEYLVVKRRGRPKKIQEVDDTDSDSEKKSRGRPKKKKKQIVEIKEDLVHSLLNAQKQEEVVDCEEFVWENITYWKDLEGNLYDSKTKEHVGVYDMDHNIVTLYQ